MTTEIISDVAFYDPNNLIPYAEKDEAIIRGVTKGLLDWSNPECYTGGAVSNGTIFTSLTSDESMAEAKNSFDAPTDGMLKINPTVSGPKIDLPSTFLLPAECNRFLAIIWLKSVKSGHAGGASNSQLVLIGALTNTSTTAQWGIGFQVFSGSVSHFRGWVPASDSSAVDVTTTDGGVIDHVFDEALHQIALEWAADADAGTYRARLYADRVVVAEKTGTYSGSILVPSLTPAIGRPSGNFNATYADGVHVGRPSLWDLTGTDLTTDEIMEADWDAAQGYLA